MGILNVPLAKGDLRRVGDHRIVNLQSWDRAKQGSLCVGGILGGSVGGQVALRIVKIEL